MRIDSNVFEAKGIYSALEKLGIDWGSQLELDGVDSFKKGFDSFLYSLQEKAKSLKLVSLFVGNIDSQVTETLLAKVFSSIGPIEGCKLVRKEKSSYGFIHYLDRRSAASAMSFLNGKQLFGLAIKVSWANASGKREDTSSHYNIFVGDLSSVGTNDMLLACFSVYPSCSGARVMWDQKTGRSRGFGFVSFRNQQVLTSIVQENRLVVGRSVVTGLQKVLELMMTSRALMPKVWGSYQMAFQMTGCNH